MKNLTIIALFVFGMQQVLCQEICAPKEQLYIDVNTLDNSKCVISEDKTQKNTSKDILISRKRYLKKRVYLNKMVFTASNLEANSVLNTATVNQVDKELLLVLLNKKRTEGVPFDVVEKIPSFLSCEESDLDSVDCFNYEMQKHIVNNFIYPKKALKKGLEGDFEIRFTIDTNGKVSNMDVSGTNNSEILKQEARRIVSLLPQFVPGEHKGRKTAVSYSFPMSFTLN